MTDGKEQQKQQEPESQNIPPPLNVDIPKNEVAETDKGSDNTPNSSQVDTPINPPTPVDVKVSVNDKRTWQPAIANIISFFSLLATIGMFWYTYKLFSQTEKATSAALQSAAAADSAVAIQRRSDSLNRIDARESARIDSTNINKRFRIDSAFLLEQIAQLNDENRRFEIENQPYLVADYPNIVTFKEGKPFVYNYQVRNIGKYPAKEIESRNEIAFFDYNTYLRIKKTPSDIFNHMDSKWIKGNIYYTKESPMIIGDNDSLKIINQVTYNAVKTGFGILVFYGEIKYYNTSNNKQRKYQYIIECKADPREKENFYIGTQHKFLYSENFDIVNH